MNIRETIDSSLTVNNDEYTIVDEKDVYLLKTVHLPKEDVFSYAFLGGMWYSKTTFSLSADTISLPYPFTTYYTVKILDKIIDNHRCKSSIYVKMPIFIIQFSKNCYLVEFNPCIQLNNQDIFLFIRLKESKESYDISFYLSKSFTIKQKDSEWLGRGKKTPVILDIKPNDSFEFKTKTTRHESWDKAVSKTMENTLKANNTVDLTRLPEQVFSQAKQALWRSYDHLRGTFLQLPWRQTPGFTFVNSSYSLVSYEAIRLDYFSQWYQETKDEDFALWINQLRNLFLNPKIYTKPKKQGNGIIWYNMTTLTKKGLEGYFYMDTGYSGYPGGQATVDLHLLSYLERQEDKNIESLVKRSLEYILSTQKEDGSWPMAIKQEGLLKFRPEKLKKYASSGGTGEAVRALFHGASYFNNSEMKDSALKGISYLADENPICYNGLRDIGVMEPEAFSAVSIINAFLDAFELTGKKIYLHYAKIYARYTLPWIYQWKSSHLDFFYNFHPISYSITPRLSPYETAWIISTYYRLGNYSTDSFWKNLNILLFNQVTSWISKTGGLSEGIFPQGLTGFKRLPMEQTFATVELMKSAKTLMKKQVTPNKTKTNHRPDDNSSVDLEKKNGKLFLIKNENILFTFDSSKAMITQMHKVSLNDLGISFSFSGCYNQKNIKRKLKHQLRGNYGKFVLGSIDAKYAVTGVVHPEPLNDIDINLIHPYLSSSKIKIHSNNKATIHLHSSIHHIKILLQFFIKNDVLQVHMNIVIYVKTHDLPSKQLILFPVIGAKSKKSFDDHVVFDGFTLQGDCKNVIKEKSFTAINQTLSTNWTHGGICKKDFILTVPLENGKK